MNCKPGDLAVIVQADNKANLGKMVVVREFVPDAEFIDGPCADAWTFDGPVMFGVSGARVKRIQDYKLRPLRDSDGEDETLTWAGKPVDVHAPIERLIPVNPLPHAVGGEPLRMWPDESTAWEGIQ